MRALRLLTLLLAWLAVPAFATPAYIHVSDGTFVQGTGNLTLTIGTCSTGNLMIAESHAAFSGDTAATPSGWTLQSPNSSAPTAYVWSRVMQAGDTTVIITWTGTHPHNGNVSCWSGSVYTDQTTIKDASADAGASSTNSIRFPSLSTPATANDLLFYTGHIGKTQTSNGATIGTATNFTKAADSVPSSSASQTSVTTQYWQQTIATSTTLGSVNYSITDTLANNQGVIIAFKTAVTIPAYTGNPALGTVTATTIPVTATADTTSTEYGVALSVGSGAPSCTQIKAGQNASGGPALYAANAALTATVQGTLTFTGVGSSPYDLYFCMTAGGNDSAVKTIAAAYKLPDHTVNPAVSAATANSISVSATPDTSATEYGVAVASGAGAPSCTQVRAGQNSGGTAALFSANAAFTAATQGTLSFTSMSGGPFDLYFCLNNPGGNSSVKSIAAAALSATWTVAPNVASTATGGYTIGFTAGSAGTVFCEALARGTATPSAAAVHAFTGALASASKAVTTVANSVTLTGLTFPIHDLYCVLNTGTDSAVTSMLAKLKTPPAGKQYTVLTGVSATSPCNQISSPSVAANDVLVDDAVTTPGGFTVNNLADCNLNYTGDTSRQKILYDIYDDSASGFMTGGSAAIWFNDVAPVCGAPDSVGPLKINIDATSYDFTTVCSSPQGDSLTCAKASGTYSPGLTLTACTLGGTPSSANSSGDTSVTTVTDTAGATATQTLTVYPLNTVTAPDCTGVDQPTCDFLLSTALLAEGTVTTTFNSSVLAGKVISQSPAAGASVTSPWTVNLTLSLGSATGVNPMSSFFLADTLPVPTNAVFRAGAAYAQDGSEYVAAWPGNGQVIYQRGLAYRQDGALTICTSACTTAAHIRGIAATARGEVIAAACAPQYAVAGVPMDVNGVACMSDIN